MTNNLTEFKESFLAVPKTRAIAKAAIALIAMAFVPILIRLVENEITPNAVIFHRLWIASSILGLGKGLLTISNKLFNNYNQPDSVDPYTSRTVPLLLATGIFFAATQIMWAWSLTQTSIANSALLHNFTPVFVAIAGFLLFDRRFERTFIIGTIVALSGSILLGFDDILYGTSKIQGDAIALLSALCLSVYLLLVEGIRKQLDAITTVLYCCCIGTIATLPIVLGKADGIFPSYWIGWLALLGLGWTIALGFGLMAYTLKFLPPEFVAVGCIPVLQSVKILQAVTFGGSMISRGLSLSNAQALLPSGPLRAGLEPVACKCRHRYGNF
ncbi:MAG: DMT family transporter [Hormoscilla sp. GUM202]|nr:DMT family transporter [Hormoscilla sp. GUM202]